MAPITFTSPELYAEHLPETHRTVNPDRTVTEEELPGRLIIGVVLNGVRQPLTELKAGNIVQAVAELQSRQPAEPEPRELQPGDLTEQGQPGQSGGSQPQAPPQ